MFVQVTGYLLLPTRWTMVQVQHTPRWLLRPTGEMPYSTPLRDDAVVGQLPEPNVAGHRFNTCSAASAQRFYSTPLEVRRLYENDARKGRGSR